MFYTVTAVDSHDRERGSWIVSSESRVEAIDRAKREMALSRHLPLDDYTFKVFPCTEGGHPLGRVR